MARFTGLDKLTKKMDGLAKFAKELDGELCKVSYDPHDPGSIDRAIADMESAIDARAASYGSNDWVEKIARQAKEVLRSRLLDSAAEKRLEKND